ncbi:copper(I)-binding protein [Kitasatospora sp. MAA4]|uniref:DUF461 domain-containing protein n=1 Tax=Kitasatospora sp. MAA4 TaxID=3035093 RepID=UPI002475844F|nr:DUF461 domain-containing protein [Kitasatospora sp. MAA4]MDH6135363.1 copper(I)-binding protein [Kitasatospora sp. MAA4]
MSRSLRRGGSAALVLALAAISLSACADGPSPDTAKVKPDTPATSIGNDLKLNNIVVVTGAMQASGQPGPANVTVNISNTGSAPETLQSLTVANGTATFADAKGATIPGIVIPAGGAVLVGGDGQPTAQLSSVTLNVGGFAPADFAFDKAGKVDVQAQVNSAAGAYASFGPASPSASASASAGASAAASGSPSTGAASPSGSASASAGASASASATTAASPGASASTH